MKYIFELSYGFCSFNLAFYLLHTTAATNNYFIID